MNSIAPVWDGNETWLVLGGGGLLAAFPLAYAIVLPALYAPLIAMLLGLVFRGVAFEYRWRDPGHRKVWDAGFFLGSLVATFAQGITLGALLQGIRVDGRAYAGGWWDWLTPFSLLTGREPRRRLRLARRLLADLEDRGGAARARPRFARRLAPALLVAIGAVSLATPFRRAAIYAERWFDYPGLIVAVPMPLLVAATAFALWRSLERRPRLAALRAHPGPVPAVDGRPRRLDLARRDPGPGHDLAGGGAAIPASSSCWSARLC